LVVKNAYAAYPDHRWILVLTEELAPKTYENLNKYAALPLVLLDGGIKDTNKIVRPIQTAPDINFRALIDAFGMIASGTNNRIFPKNYFQFITYPQAPNEVGSQNYYPENKRLTLEEMLKTLSVWAAFSSFSESRRGALSEGMEANFFIAKHAISLKGEENNYSLQTFIRGVKVYDAQKEF